MPGLMLQLMLVIFNNANVTIDAYRILKHKTIAHGINFSAYILFSITLFYVNKKPDLDWLGFLLFLVSAFCNRQLSFDIPLNIRRGLNWDYVSLDNPPKALLDRIEVKVFGYNGRFPVLIYSLLLILTLIIDQWLH